jgi:hypothetical protein
MTSTALKMSYWKAICMTLIDLGEDIIPTVEVVTPLAKAKWESMGNTSGNPALTMEWVLGDYESDWRDKRRGYSLTNRPQDSWEEYVPIFILHFDESDED